MNCIILSKRKRTIAVALAVVVPVLLGILAAFFLWPRTDELDRWKTRMRARGENFTLSEVAPEFSTQKVEFIKQFRTATSGLLAYPVPPGEIQMMEIIAAGYATVGSRLPYPLRTAKTNVAWTALEEQIAGSSNALATLEALLADVPKGSASDYSDPQNLRGGDLIALRKATHQLSMAMMNELHRGALDNALVHLHALLRLAAAEEEEGSLVHHMVRTAIAGVAVSATWEALQAPGWDDARLATLQGAWAKVELLKRSRYAFDLERAWIVALYQIARTNSSGPSAAVGAPGLTGIKQAFVDNVYSPLWQKAWSKNDELFYLRALQPIGEAIHAAQTNRSWQSMSMRLQGLEYSITNMSTLDQFRYQLARIAIPNWQKALKALMRQECQIQMARAAIAIQRHQIRHGHPPASLAALAPDYLAEASVDYMTGRPLQYALNADGTFVLYSTGENGRDDDGLGDDVVWPQPGPPAPVTLPLSTEKLISISVSNVSAQDALIHLARQAGVPIRFAPKLVLPGHFSLELHEATANEALQKALEKLGLSLVRGPKHNTSCVITNGQVN